MWKRKKVGIALILSVILKEKNSKVV
jgi:hypothetical protein